jgi:hypothetical protein
MTDTPATLGIIAGSGALPLRIAESCVHSGRSFFIVALEDAADMNALAAYPHAQVRLGAVGEAIAQLRGAGAQDLVLAGGVKRPSMGSLKPDATGAKLIARLGWKLFAGDDALLKGLLSFLEDEGFHVVGADDLLADLIGPEGVLTRAVPDEQASADITLGLEAARALGARDEGQAVIVENGQVLGEETAAGTDELITRCAALMKHKGRAILVKAKKPDQESRVDLPAIGPDTLKKLAAAGMMGVAYSAGGALVLDRAEVVRIADDNALFVVGI